MSKTKLLLLTHEMAPFLELTEIAKSLGQLPNLIHDKGFEIRVLMPRFGCINERRNRLHEVIRLSGLNIVVDDTDNPLIIKVASLPSAKMQVYFLDNEDYFQRKYVFRDANDKFFADNDERAIFYAKGALETVKKLGWAPDIIHCHDWMASFVPLYVKKCYNTDPLFKNSKVVYSAYEDSFSESLDKRVSSKGLFSGVEESDFDLVAKEHNCLGMQQMAAKYSDAVIYNGKKINTKLRSLVDGLNIPTFEFDNSTEDIANFATIYEEISSESMAEVE